MTLDTTQFIEYTLRGSRALLAATGAIAAIPLETEWPDAVRLSESIMDDWFSMVLNEIDARGTSEAAETLVAGHMAAMTMFMDMWQQRLDQLERTGSAPGPESVQAE